MGPVDEQPGAAGLRVLLAEDEQQLAGLLLRLLEGEGFRVDHARDGQTALHLGLTRPYDLLLLDRGLPAVQGLDVLTRLRARGVTAPALVLTARGSVADRVDGLDAGADDYLTKPFAVEELLARLRALLRRHQDRAEALQVGERTVELASRTVTGGSGPAVELTGREAELLVLLARRPSRVFSRDELLLLVFSEVDSATVVDTYVHYLRRKLGRGVIRTVRGVGYRMGSA
jgi:two-component system, OmpR family, response regulator QseB